MYFKSIKINNYKSIGLSDNAIDLESSVTAVIGKNESGKSNILEAVGACILDDRLNSNLAGHPNRNNLEIPVTLEVILAFTAEEASRYCVREDTHIVLDKNEIPQLSGGLAEVMRNDCELIEARDYFQSHEIGQLYSNIDSNKRIYIDRVKVIDQIIMRGRTDTIAALRSYVLVDGEDAEALSRHVDVIESRTTEYYSLLPKVFYRDQASLSSLPSKITSDDFRRAANDESAIQKKLLIAAGISQEDIERAFTLSNPGERKTIRDRNVRRLDALATDFQNFYRHDDYRIDFEFENSDLNIYAFTGPNAMQFTERSNGFRWYFSLFVNLMAEHPKDSDSRSTLFVLDEPGVFLHVNAQHELLGLFEQLCKSGNQVLYSTHSPSMLDIENAFAIRATEKDSEEGNTRIIRSVFSPHLQGASQRDTLSPLCNALGFNLRYSVSPINSHNVIVEGITDKMYLEAMMCYLKVPTERRPNIIASVGADNIPNIASILLGWGVDFRALLDFDTKGCKVARDLQKLSSDAREVVFDSVTGDDLTCQERIDWDEARTIESLVCSEDRKNPEGQLTEENKKLLAIEFRETARADGCTLSDETVEAFRSLFSRLGIA